jgi:hypothetical protein
VKSPRNCPYTNASTNVHVSSNPIPANVSGHVLGFRTFIGFGIAATP